jgi:hypothetical protein
MQEHDMKEQALADQFGIALATLSRYMQGLSAMQKEKERHKDQLDKYEPRIKDAFGRPRYVNMGVPSGNDCHQLLRISPDLAESVIRAHIAQAEARLVELNEAARVELDTEPCVGRQPEGNGEEGGVTER